MRICEECGTTKRVAASKFQEKTLCYNCISMYKKHPINQIPPKGQMIYDNEDRPICHICGRAFNKLGQHVFNRHGMSADEYKELFELNRNVGLTSNKTKEKLQQAVKDNYDQVVVANLVNKGKHTRFNKNNKGRTKDKVRLQAYNMLCDRIKNINKARKLMIDKNYTREDKND